MKIASCSLALVAICLSGCQQMKSASKHSRAKPSPSYVRSQEEIREDKLRNVREITEPRAKSYERRGYTAEEARAIAEIEYYSRSLVSVPNPATSVKK